MTVKSEIPLLLSKKRMKAAELKIDFVNDRINIFGQNIPFHFTTSGHYTIPLNETNLNLKTSSLEDSNFVEVLLTIDNTEEKLKKEKKYLAIKLQARLIDLIKTAGISDKDLLDMVRDLDKICEICMRYKRPSSRPVVGFSLAHDFNEIVAMGLKQFRGVYIVPMVDHPSRYSAGAIISSKQKEVIIDKIFKHWIAISGTPNLFLSDNGREFNNELFREMCKQLSSNIKTNAAESPWSKPL